MMRLPKLPCDLPRHSREIVALRGVNFSDQFQDGDLAACENLSARRYPYFTTRPGRKRLLEYQDATALAAWEQLAVVQGETLYYGGEAVGTVTAGEKQFAVVNTKLVIWPDKKYLDLQSKALGSLEAEAAGSKAVFTETTLTLTGGPDLTGRFAAGDTVTISGCKAVPENNKDVRVLSVSAAAVTVASGGFQAGEETGTVNIQRRLPDLDFICESENRLWGCSNSQRTIFASALGDPTNFYNYNGLSTDSYALAVGSEGAFTGCCKLSGGVLFWKERTLHKLLGSYPAEYSLYSYSVEGLKAGCHKSMAVLNEVLYYLGLGGVYAYAGGTPQCVSQSLGARDWTGAAAGSDGERYYLSVLEGETRHLLVYDTRLGLWLREDGTRCRDFARLGTSLYFLTDTGEVYQTDGGTDADLPWLAQFTPFYETLQGRKRCARLTLRLELPKGSWLEADVRCDGGRWETAARRTGQVQDAVTLVLPIRRCDKYEVRLRGKGPCTILALSREFMVGSGR